MRIKKYMHSAKQKDSVDVGMIQEPIQEKQSSAPYRLHQERLTDRENFHESRPGDEVSSNTCSPDKMLQGVSCF